MAVLVPANLVGALVSFTYFTFVDLLAPPRSHEFGGAVRFFAVGFTLLSVPRGRLGRSLVAASSTRSTAAT